MRESSLPAHIQLWRCQCPKLWESIAWVFNNTELGGLSIAASQSQKKPLTRLHSLFVFFSVLGVHQCAENSQSFQKTRRAQLFGFTVARDICVWLTSINGVFRTVRQSLVPTTTRSDRLLIANTWRGRLGRWMPRLNAIVTFMEVGTGWAKGLERTLGGIVEQVGAFPAWAHRGGNMSQSSGTDP